MNTVKGAINSSGLAPYFLRLLFTHSMENTTPPTMSLPSNSHEWTNTQIVTTKGLTLATFVVITMIIYIVAP